MTAAIRDPHEGAKRAAARQAMDHVVDGMTVGLGSGSTAELVIRELGARVAAGLDLRAVATSVRSEAIARSLGITIVDLADLTSPIDVTIDGADEVDPRGRLIKGRGGALLREKIVASTSRALVICVDESKLSSTLGAVALPIEVVRFAAPIVQRWLTGQGVPAVLRRDPATGSPVVTDEGHLLLDCSVGRIADAEALAERLDRRVGIVEHGLFLGFNPTVIVGRAPDL